MSAPEVTAADFARAALAELEACWPNAPVHIRMRCAIGARTAYENAKRYGFRITRSPEHGAEQRD